jgi:hypothetical protein
VDAITGLYFIWQSSQFYLAALGVHVDESLRPRSLSFAWSLCLGVLGYMAAAGRYLGTAYDFSHWLRIGLVSGLFLGYVVADMRGEPGCGWLSYPGRLIFTHYSA